ncbi:lipid II:glycine glycyltransferase FemX [Candidatus Blastococcus massiliensis]|uniref:lipid II:glycine glycyltransferase FemX n=1 Tax=Candidatus Blastococcus massiliensis TaxID=1470358 RepID=UPI0004BC491B|nr:GNAT family N-acetyltransferase [Candidatus Blastococcus massiliensis]
MTAGPAGTRHVDPRTDPLWRELVSSPGGSLFTSPPWLTAVSDTYGFTPAARVQLDASGRPRAGFAWTDVDDLRGRRRIALPFCDRADPIVPDVAAWSAVADEALAGDLPLTLRCLDGSPIVDDGRLALTGEAAWHATPLTGGPDDLHAALRPQVRRNIATAERSGVQVVLSDSVGAVRELHTLHVELRKRKYRLLAQPREFFDRIWTAFAPSDGVLTALAMVDGRPVAGAMYLVWQDVVYYKFGASRAEFLPLRPNDAIHWQLIRWAVERGLRVLDWGLSDLDQPGLRHYKAGWAAVERRIRTFNVGGPPLGRRFDVEELLSVVTELLTDPDVPDDVTARGGAALYRYFC